VASDNTGGGVNYVKLRVYYTAGGGGAIEMIKVNGVWKTAASKKILVGGSWKEIVGCKILVGGVWK
jgi:hypothetical protein